MKTKFLLFGMVLSLMTISCTNEENPVAPTSTSEEAVVEARIDDVTDDISKIVDDQYYVQENSAKGKTAAAETFLPACVTISTVVTSGTWTRTVDFGTQGCTMPNGNVLKGKIIVSGSINFDQPSHTISYSFDNFYHNDILIVGNKTVVRTLVSTNDNPNLHPLATMNLELTVTFPDGKIYKRVGTRVREMIAGFNTPLVWRDNVFAVTGNWTTNFPGGRAQTSTITSPLIVKMDCNHIVQGTITFTRNDRSAVLDYGNGDCDNKATVTANNTTVEITLGK